jgi:hypothetical protein
MRIIGVLASGLGLLLLALGCQSSRPNLKPPDSPQVLNVPPAEGRYNVSSYPKEAFDNRDPLKKLNGNQDIVPVRGPSMGRNGQFQ